MPIKYYNFTIYYYLHINIQSPFIVTQLQERRKTIYQLYYGGYENQNTTIYLFREDS